MHVLFSYDLLVSKGLIKFHFSSSAIHSSQTSSFRIRVTPLQYTLLPKVGTSFFLESPKCSTTTNLDL